MEIFDAADDNILCVSNLINITDFSKRDLYNKLKEMEITLANLGPQERAQLLIGRHYKRPG